MLSNLMLSLEANAAQVFVLFAAPLCIVAAYNDLSRMKLPNWLVLSLAGVYVLLGPFVLEVDAYLWGFARGAVMYFIGMFAFMYMGVGAGDGKFAAAMALFIPRVDAPIALFLFAAFILAAFVTHRACKFTPLIRRLTPTWASWEHKKFPMGLALSGTLITYLSLAAFS